MAHYVCTDATNPAGRPTPAQVKALGATGVRMVFFERPEYYSYHGSIKGAGLEVAVVLARESFTGVPIDDIIGALPADCDVVAIGNEPDGKGASSWTMSPSSFRSLIRDCAPMIRARCPNAQIVAGGLVSGHPSWLEPIAQDIAGEVDFLDVHPYNKTPGEAETLLDEYFERYRIPLMVLEWNRPPDQILSFTQMLSRTAESDAWFCWSDGMVNGFGLIDDDGDRKPEYAALAMALLPAQPPSGSFVLGFKQVADRHPDIVGQPLDPREFGPWLNCSLQRTTNGLLIWGNFVGSGDQKGFISNDGTRYVWKTNRLDIVNAQR